MHNFQFYVSWFFTFKIFFPPFTFKTIFLTFYIFCSVIVQELVLKIPLARISKIDNEISDDASINLGNNDVTSANIAVNEHENDNDNTSSNNFVTRNTRSSTNISFDMHQSNNLDNNKYSCLIDNRMHCVNAKKCLPRR